MKIPEIMTHQPWNNKEIWNNVCGTFRFLFVKKSGEVGIVLPWTYDNLIYIYLCNQSLIPELYFWEMIWKYVFASSVTHSWSRSDYSLFITRTSTIIRSRHHNPHIPTLLYKKKTKIATNVVPYFFVISWLLGHYFRNFHLHHDYAVYKQLRNLKENKNWETRRPLLLKVTSNKILHCHS
jgi:hypothetical protein